METNRATTELPIATRVGLIETLARELWITQVDITKSKDEREKELRDVTGKAVKRPSDAAVQSVEHFAAGVAVAGLAEKIAEQFGINVGEIEAKRRELMRR
ncbi:MAG: hypothetical protein AAB838_03565 [Patescibacteria group bacterium]